MKNIIIVVVFGLVLTSYSEARKRCEVSYKKEYGYSDYHEMTITFLTGAELNKASAPDDPFAYVPEKYQSRNVYALLWFDEDEVAILKVDVPFGVTMMMTSIDPIFSSDAFIYLFPAISYAPLTAVQVNGSSGLSWKIREPKSLGY